jgi:uncharacterized protein
MSEDTDKRVVHGIPWALGADEEALKRSVAQESGIPLASIEEVRTLKVSLDARRRDIPRRIVQAEVYLKGEPVPAKDMPKPRRGTMKKLVAGEAPIVVGTGPAGLWAALRFVEEGQPCIILDRGAGLEKRHRDVVGLRRRGRLDPESNLCFGEGGAGTYSDGKLYTRKRHGWVRRVYEDMVAFGAQERILVDAHPHVGTNRLIGVMDNLRAFLLDSGCELRFGTRVDGLCMQGTKVTGVRLESGEELYGSSVILACGHSARDTYQWLHTLGVNMTPKGFAVGARVEHPQSLVNSIQYGAWCDNPHLEAATYAVKAQVGKRGIYSFCMCPGGFVIPTPTELGHLNVNGMSSSNRGSDFANSALVVTVTPEDYYLESPGDLDHHGPLKGLFFQRELEKRAFEAGGGDYSAPAQRLTDFLEGKSGTLPERTSYRPGLAPTNLKELLPQRLHDPLGRALGRFEQKMRGFLTEESILIGFETTTSSPVRLVRNEQLMAPGFDNLYPCGEGAGYAGGIVSSAIDGIRCAESALSHP